MEQSSVATEADLLVGRPVLLVVDIQQDVLLPAAKSGIARAEGQAQVITGAEALVAAARAARVPVIFTQEAHRSTGVDFGRELDGAESEHCLEDEPSTALWPTLVPRSDRGQHEYVVVKRRYSAFFGTDLDIVLRGLGAQTLVLVGNLTDVCIHYTFVDAHQHDYHVRVVEDCVVGSSTARHESALDAMEYLQHGARCSSGAVIEAFRSCRSWLPEFAEVGR